MENKEYKGFMHIQCSKCGKIKTFRPQEPITHYKCECGHVTGLSGMRRAVIRCECGKRSVYHTNVGAELVEIDCVRCGCPNVSVWSHKRGIYKPIKEEKG